MKTLPHWNPYLVKKLFSMHVEKTLMWDPVHCCLIQLLDRELLPQTAVERFVRKLNGGFVP